MQRALTPGSTVKYKIYDLPSHPQTFLSFTRSYNKVFSEYSQQSIRNYCMQYRVDRVKTERDKVTARQLIPQEITGSAWRDFPLKTGDCENREPFTELPAERNSLTAGFWTLRSIRERAQSFLAYRRAAQYVCIFNCSSPLSAVATNDGWLYRYGYTTHAFRHRAYTWKAIVEMRARNKAIDVKERRGCGPPECDDSETSTAVISATQFRKERTLHCRVPFGI